MANTFLVNLNTDYSKESKYLSTTLLDKIEENLKNNKKIILYLNKRWDFSSMICSDCSYLYKCKNCDLKMYVHKKPEKLICHFCWYTKEIPIKCEKCKWKNLAKIGFGTQQLETLIKNIFPLAKIFRLDTDNVANISAKKDAFENIKNANIIIWTKMITTGFDLENIGLISIILLEAELSIPKYDIEEKTFINLKQLIWRGGRKWQITETIIQTYIPENPFVKQVFESNYKQFFKETLLERKIFNYPPFSEIFILQYKNYNKQKAFEYMEKMFLELEKENSKKLSHPPAPSLKSKGRGEKENKKQQGSLAPCIEIIFNKTSFKRNNQYFYNIILKWKKIPEFIEKTIKTEIFRNKDLNIIRES